MKLDDFLISLGFDISKLDSTIKEVESKLNKAVSSSNKKSVADTKKSVKERAKVELSEAEKLEKERQRQKVAYEKKELARRVKIENQLADAHVKAAATANRKTKSKKALPTTLFGSPREEVVQWAKQLGKDSNPQLDALGNYYRKLQSNQTELGNKSEEVKRIKALGQITNSQAFLDLKSDFGEAGKEAAKEYLKQAEDVLSKGDLEGIKRIKAQLTKDVRDARKTTSGGITSPQSRDFSRLGTEAANAALARGVSQNTANMFVGRITTAKNVQEAKAYANALGMISTRLNALDKNKELRLQTIIKKGDIPALQQFNKELGRTSNEMRRAERRAVGLRAAKNGMIDSTRNLVRSYASMYAVIASTRSINKVGQDFEAMNSSMLAAMGTQRQAQQEVQFLTDLTSRLGLSTLDAADSYSKFVFASKGKLDTDQVRELFTGLSEMGTALGISNDRMKLSQVAIQQMMNKGTVQSEELKFRFHA